MGGLCVEVGMSNRLYDLVEDFFSEYELVSEDECDSTRRLKEQVDDFLAKYNLLCEEEAESSRRLDELLDKMLSRSSEDCPRCRRRQDDGTPGRYEGESRPV